MYMRIREVHNSNDFTCSKSNINSLAKTDKIINVLYGNDTNQAGTICSIILPSLYCIIVVLQTLVKTICIAMPLVRLTVS